MDRKPLTFAQVTKRNYQSVEPYAELGMKGVIESYIDFEQGKAVFRVDRAKLSGLSTDALKIIRIGDTASHLLRIETYLATQIFGRGPKVFRPTAEQLFALENMKLNIEVRDFHMPFDTIIVEMPEAYSTARVVANERAINYSVLHLHRPSQSLMHNLVYDEAGMKTWWTFTNETDLIESWFDLAEEKWTADIKVSDLPVDIAEFESEQLVRRAVLNYCLLLDECGSKRVGPASPNEYTQLLKWVQKNNKHTEGNKRRFQAQPVVYRLERPPTPLVRTITKEQADSESGSTGRTMPYHNRRGHYKMQPYGPKSELRKRIRIPAVIVNAHLMPGLPPVQEYKS